MHPSVFIWCTPSHCLLEEGGRRKEGAPHCSKAESPAPASALQRDHRSHPLCATSTRVTVSKGCPARLALQEPDSPPGHAKAQCAPGTSEARELWPSVQRLFSPNTLRHMTNWLKHLVKTSRYDGKSRELLETLKTS